MNAPDCPVCGWDMEWETSAKIQWETRLACLNPLCGLALPHSATREGALAKLDPAKIPPCDVMRAVTRHMRADFPRFFRGKNA
jgi:hypothetical protein